ncbi:MAG: GTP 3',8-cyclase MoaA [Gemmataceae bacterium]
MSSRIPMPPVSPVTPVNPTGKLLDGFGRVHNNLRISVTDRCNLRCTYCMPEEVTFLDRSELLTFEEIAAFVRAVTPLGIDKVRLTGGEPLMRKNLAGLVAQLSAIPELHDIGLTTNGLLLASQAQSLYDAGLRRLNVSLDTLDPGRFRELSRREGLNDTLAGLEAAKKAGFGPIKINAVAIRGFIEQDAVPLARYCRENGFELRFIEYMPIGAESWERAKCFFAHEIMDLLEAGIAPLSPAGHFDPSAPAMDFEYADGSGRVGFIASVSRPFCRSCNRIRLTADGKLRNCLFALDEVDVKTLLRTLPCDEEHLRNVVRENVALKWEGHEINTAKFVKPGRTMHAIGG